MPSLDMISLMARETRIAYERVSAKFHDLASAPGWVYTEPAFCVVRTPANILILYFKGEGVTVDRTGARGESDETLWLNGSMYSAIACINGLVPIHASAVASAGKVYAFSGLSGAGKSTMVAALGARGFPMFCDDTLVLDPADPRQIVCLPGHKRLKLTAEALALTGSERGEDVGGGLAKFYARPAAGELKEPLPLGQLIFLDYGPEPVVLSVRGAEQLALVNDDHYTKQLFASVHAFTPAQNFRHLTRLAGRLPIARFVRPKEAARFQESISAMAEYIKAASFDERHGQ